MILAGLLTALMAVEPGVEPDAGVHAEAAAQAWNRGALAEAGAYAVQAYDALGEGSCLATPDGARLAFMAGVASHAGQIDGYSGYYFWAAQQLDRAAGGLSSGERELTRRLGAEPGRQPAEDWRYARSPLLANPRPRAARGCSAILPGLDPDPPLNEAALVIARTRFNLGQYAQIEPVYAYPDLAVRALAGRVRGLYEWSRSGRYWGFHTFVFGPCYTAYNEAMEAVDICTGGAPAP